MKKIIYMAVLLVSLGMTSCSKDDIENTATVNTAGQWYVTVDAVDDKGNVVISDPYGLGRKMQFTYNTAANTGNEMYVDDNETLWNYKTRVVTDQNSLTFASAVTSAMNNERGDAIMVTITDGKILKGAGHQKNGSVADSIVYYVTFSDDENPAKYGFSKYKVSGVRYSGLEEND